MYNAPMRVLVCSGGGAHGSFQIGVCEKLAEAGMQYDGYAGISVGNLLAAHCSGYQDFAEAVADYKDVWINNVHTDADIIKPWWFSWLGYLAFIPAPFKGSLYSTAPFRSLVQKVFSPAKTRASGKKLAVSAVSMTTGKLRTWNEKTVTHDGIVASASFPLAFQPVQLDGEEYLDGGLRDVTPISQAIAMGATELDIIMCQPEGMEPIKKSKWKVLKMFDLAKRVIGILMDELIENDIQGVVKTNKRIESGAVSDRRMIKVRVFRPQEKLHSTSLNFKQEDWLVNYHTGLEVAEALLKDQ